MKVLCNGEYIEFKDELEPGFKELDLHIIDEEAVENNNINLENTIELKSVNLEDTQPYELGELNDGKTN